jgi:hypothetical protein
MCVHMYVCGLCSGVYVLVSCANVNVMIIVQYNDTADHQMLSSGPLQS